jgi:hypothetical protein
MEPATEHDTDTADLNASTLGPRRLYVVVRPSRPCEYCGNLMENPRADQRFCRNPRHRRPHLVAPPAVRPCDFCGEPIEKPRRGQRFCRKPRRCARYASLGHQFADCGRSAPAVGGLQTSAQGIGAGGARRVESLPVPVSIARVHEISPMISILLESMPAPGTDWPHAARAQWTAVFDRTLDALYPGGGR